MLTTVESKVVAGAGGAGLGAVTAQLVLWAADQFLLDGPGPLEVPEPVAAFVLYACPLLAAWAAGWLAPHTPRPDLDLPADLRPADPLPYSGPGAVVVESRGLPEGYVPPSAAVRTEAPALDPAREQHEQQREEAPAFGVLAADHPDDDEPDDDGPERPAPPPLAADPVAVHPVVPAPAAGALTTTLTTSSGSVKVVPVVATVEVTETGTTVLPWLTAAEASAPVRGRRSADPR